jgi:phosphatidylglycerophosphate synthase
MGDWFLTPTEKDTFSNWVTKDIDNSITERILSAVWNKVKNYVPDNVAPNILSFGGLLCLVQSWYICYLYMDYQPKLMSLTAVLLFIIYHILDGIDGKHAKNTNNDSPLGEFFAHCCSNVGFVFSALSVCYVLGIDDLYLQWYLVQIAQLIALRCHIRAFITKVVSFSMFTGPGEGLFLLLIMMAVKALVPSLFVEFGVLVSQLVVILNDAGLTGLDPNNHRLIFSHAVHLTYYILYIATFYTTLTIHSKNRATRNGLVFCLCYRAVPAVLMWLGLIPGSFTVLDLISQGLFMAVLTSDIILAKMASRIFILISLYLQCYLF